MLKFLLHNFTNRVRIVTKNFENVPTLERCSWNWKKNEIWDNTPSCTRNRGIALDTKTFLIQKFFFGIFQKKQFKVCSKLKQARNFNPKFAQTSFQIWSNYFILLNLSLQRPNGQLFKVWLFPEPIRIRFVLLAYSRRLIKWKKPTGRFWKLKRPRFWITFLEFES